MKHRSARLAVRALIVQDARVLLVNAFHKSRGSDLWCAPGGGVQSGQSLPENLKREVYEETGLSVDVGELALVKEFHDPVGGFHQVDLFFRCQVSAGVIDADWQDTDAIVSKRRFFSLGELVAIRLKPDSLPDVAFGASGPPPYDALEPITS